MGPGLQIDDLMTPPKDLPFRGRFILTTLKGPDVKKIR